MNNAVFDLDGTLALIEHRRHFVQGKKDWRGFFKACVDDRPNQPVIDILLTLVRAGNWSVEIWSGRSDEVRSETENWLDDHGVQYDALIMRGAADYRPDEILKAEFLEDFIAEMGCKPDIVFDDRDKVVEMWRSHGIVCAQVAPGDF